MPVSMWQDLAADVTNRCVAAGLDLIQPFAVHWYNEHVDEPLRIADFRRRPCLGLLIGNTRALWERFIASLRVEPLRLLEPDPLDRFVEQQITRVCAALPVAFECYWAHGAQRIAIQQLAQRAGLAYLSPGHLSVHPIFGPWIALRAVVVVDVEGPHEPAPQLPPPCHACEQGCEPAFVRAAATLVLPASQAAVTPHWRLWLAARDACPLGQAHRYGNAQIEYHYTKDMDVLRDASRTKTT